jgi:hypothetical protein
MYNANTMEQYEDAILAKLPPRPARNPTPPTRIDYTTTTVAAYVRDVVETMTPVPADESFVQDVMEALCAQGLPPPVTPSTLAAVLKGLYTNARLNALFRAHAPLIPRLLKTLNGKAYALVPADILAEASARELAMSMTAAGWGVAEPPVHATAYRLLVSSGLPEELLPVYTILPGGARVRLSAAWAAACAQFGWEPVQPPKDCKAVPSKG